MRICNELFNVEAIYDEDNQRILAQCENPFKNCYSSIENQMFLEKEYDKFIQKVADPKMQKKLLLCYFGNIRLVDIRHI